jgi:hypothetical protein
MRAFIIPAGSTIFNSCWSLQADSDPIISDANKDRAKQVLDELMGEGGFFTKNRG